jgi:two-component system CheB/CheR fusion protein
LQNLQAFPSSRARLKTGKLKRLTNLRAKSNKRRNAARRGLEGRASGSTAASALSRSARPARAVPISAFSIVGVGASAGGLEAFTELLKHLPLDSGMGFVLVQHLDPQHESALTQLLKRATSMPVHEVTNNLRVEANNVYVIPPNTNLGISEGILTLKPRPQGRVAHHPIDAFFESLAQDRRERAIGVILSGTATDGTLGLEAIKAEGGITFTQDESARYDSMPRSAVAAGCVDFVLRPENIAKELARIAKHPYVANGPGQSQREAARAEANGPRIQAPAVKDGFKKILLLLRNHCGVDFSLYKSATIQRRVTRRMVLSRHNTVEDYARFLQSNDKELDALYSDCLISVTSFFRNLESFDLLQRKVFPRLLKQRTDEPLRVWVLGCSTGQEAYSLAMVFQESIEKLPRARKLQVFATDLNEALLEKARHGLYAKNLVQDIPPERLRRFFVEEDGGYRVIKSLREIVVFARQNLISDPPFSRIDLISCRNLLIYLEPSLQQKALPTFHYALKPEGFLFLGASESIGGFTGLFQPVDRKHKIYSRKTAATLPVHLPIRKEPGDGKRAVPGSGTRRAGPGQLPVPAEQPDGLRGELTAQREADRVMVNQFAPPGVLVNAELQILQFRGSTAAWLEPPTGKASFDVLKMAREGLMLPLRAAINKAKKENKTVRRENIQMQQNGKSRTANVEVIPLKNLRERCFLILFEDRKESSQKETKETKKGRRETPPSLTSLPSEKSSSRRNAELERELAETRDYLQAIEEQHEASHEELQASNEEVQSANEELQSINEELETAKEELESSNEELATVNEEMVNRNAELSRLNSDLVNLETSTSLGVILFARNLTIRRFSAQAQKHFNLMASDVGRPVRNVRHNFVFPAAASEPTDGLEAMLSEVIASVHARECDVQDKNGRWHSLRARPYFTLDNKVDGAVLVVVDITDLKRTERETKAARDYAEAIIRTARDPLVVLRADLKVDKVNDAFYKTFKITLQETENVLIYELDHSQWSIPKLRQLLEEIIPRNSSFNDFEVTHDFDRIGRRTMLLNARRLDSDSGATQKILLGIEDVTERRRGEEALRESEERYRTLFNLGPVGIYSVDHSGVIQDFNSRAAEIWGRKPVSGDADERFCGSFRIFRPDGTYMPHDQCPMAEVVSGKISDVRDAEAIIERPDGSRVTVLANIRPLKNDRREVTGAINCFYDITERKQAEQTLGESERRYRSLFESIDEGFCVIKVLFDSQQRAIDFVYVETNPAFEKQTGLHDAQGRRILELVPTLERHWFETYGRVALTGEPVRFQNRAEVLGRWFDVYAFRVEAPELRKVAVIFTDITQQREAQEALRDSEERYRTLFNLGPVGIYSIDISGVIRDFNRRAAELWGRQPAVGDTDERFCGSFKMFRPDGSYMPHDQCPMAEVLSGKIPEARDAEVVIERPDGSRITALVNIQPLKNDRGNVTGAINCFFDITERLRIEDALRESKALVALKQAELQIQQQRDELTRLSRLAMLGEFSASLAHELNQPLSAIMCNVGPRSTNFRMTRLTWGTCRKPSRK